MRVYTPAIVQPIQSFLHKAKIALAILEDGRLIDVDGWSRDQLLEVGAVVIDYIVGESVVSIEANSGHQSIVAVNHSGTIGRNDNSNNGHLKQVMLIESSSLSSSQSAVNRDFCLAAIDHGLDRGLIDFPGLNYCGYYQVLTQLKPQYLTRLNLWQSTATFSISLI